MNKYATDFLKKTTVLITDFRLFVGVYKLKHSKRLRQKQRIIGQPPISRNLTPTNVAAELQFIAFSIPFIALV